jgi:hypothetical protein
MAIALSSLWEGLGRAMTEAMLLTLPTAISRGILASQGFQRIYPQQAS